jgi:type IV pilus assembly protein PilY1
MVPLLNATRPITSPAALSVDPFDNAWVYVGSGRYISNADKTNTDVQYMYGVKDPFFNRDHSPAGRYATNYYHNYSTSLELQIADLFSGDPYIIIEGGYDVYVGVNRIGDFNAVIDLARAQNGWIRSLTITGERILTKFAILGGIVFTPSFVPNSDVCGFGGDSYLYGQYYETGTAYKKPVFAEEGVKNITISGRPYVQVLDRIELGAGKASAIGVHVGTEGAKALIQQSTGTVVTEELKPALKVKSGLRSWIEQ